MLNESEESSPACWKKYVAKPTMAKPQTGWIIQVMQAMSVRRRFVALEAVHIGGADPQLHLVSVGHHDL
jgi:hypothetical protein